MASGPDVAVAEYHVLLGGQPFEANRATGVDLVSGDADLGPQTILKAIGKAGRGVDHHRTGVHLGQEPAGTGVVLGNDAVGMLGTVTIDVLDGTIKPVYHTYRQNRSQVLLMPVLLGSRSNARQNGTGALAAPQFHALGGELCGQQRQYII